jgi:hypothetical protein
MSFPTNNTYNTATQTSVPIKPNVGAPGLLYDVSDNVDIITLIAATAIPFGAFVFENADGFCSVPALTGNVTAGTASMRGIAAIDHNKYSGEGYDIGDAVRVVRRGRIWVLTDAAANLAFNAALFVRFAAGAGGAVLGAFRGDADTATASSPPVSMSVFHGGGVGQCVVEVGG